MPALYVTEQGALIGRRGDSLEVRLRGSRLLSVPLHRVSQVIILGAVQITTAAIGDLLDRGVDVAFVTSHGRFRGRLQPALGGNVVLRRAQYRRADDAGFCLEVSRAIAAGKLANQRAVCLRWERRRGVEASASQEIARCLRDLATAESKPAAMGLEGIAGRHYYAAMREALRDDMPFPRRTRRPPTDPVSLLLSLSAALLQAQVHAAVSVVGFDPFLGYFHGERYGRPALVLDMMEEFRPLVADAAAVSAVNRRVVQPDDFTQDESGLLLKDHAVKDFVRHFDRRIGDSVRHPVLGQTRTYRQWIEYQARILAQTVLGELERYQPFTPAH